MISSDLCRYDHLASSDDDKPTGYSLPVQFLDRGAGSMGSVETSDG